jgi:hypothetical protein
MDALVVPPPLWTAPRIARQMAREQGIVEIDPVVESA